jgi:surface antigen
MELAISSPIREVTSPSVARGACRADRTTVTYSPPSGREHAQALARVVEDDALGPEPEPDAWIEIELVDDAGNAVPNATYRIESEDGRVRTGTTNSSGKAREEGLHGGSCKVSFPEIHGPDWAKVA